MPLYFFHLFDGDQVEGDDVGTELPNPEAAMTNAGLFLNEVRSDLQNPRRAYVRVLDEQGEEIGIVPSARP